jgi:hypothetical protein
MVLYEIVSLMKQQAEAFEIDPQDLAMADLIQKLTSYKTGLELYPFP